MRLIDVDDLGVGRCSKDVLPAAYCAGWNGLLGLIEKAPTVDAVPVVHGRWEFLGPNRLIKECMCGTCSACKVRSKYIVNTMLCPNCGADDGWRC